MPRTIETSASEHSMAVGRNVHGDVTVTHIEGGAHFLVPSGHQSPHQIPEPTQAFKGRKKELDELSTAIREGGVTISGIRGMGSIGKTELALKLAERLAPDYQDAKIFFDMKGTSLSPLAPVDAMGQVIHVFHPEAELPVSESERRGLYCSAFHNWLHHMCCGGAGCHLEVGCWSDP